MTNVLALWCKGRPIAENCAAQALREVKRKAAWMPMLHPMHIHTA
jgi:hypothetical protein